MAGGVLIHREPTVLVAPGCPLATTLVKLSYMDAIEEWLEETKRHVGPNRVTADALIDDLIITVSGANPKTIQHIVITALWELEGMVQQQIRASLVAKKSESDFEQAGNSARDSKSYRYAN